MKKWLYVVSVGGMLAVFLFFYFAHLKEADAREKVRLEKAAQERKAEAQRKAEIEAKAREDAERRSAERLAAEQKKEADRLAKWESENKKIQDETNEFNAKTEAASKRISELDVQLNSLRQNKEKINRETFELQKQVEQARVAKRTAELEIQRMTDMIAKRAADSALSRAPAPAKPSS